MDYDTQKIKTEDEVDYIDSGRGMIAFILILVAYFAALFAFGTFGKTGVYQWIPHFITPLMYVPYIAGIGALLLYHSKNYWKIDFIAPF